MSEWLLGTAAVLFVIGLLIWWRLLMLAQMEDRGDRKARRKGKRLRAAKDKLRKAREK